MNQTGNEVEVKFYIQSLAALEKKLVAMGAKLDQPRVLEMNLRFDTEDNVLTTAHKVLRLRSDTRARLTYKEPAVPDQPVSIRREIEFEVSDFKEARAFLEALGYRVSITYEKYRSTYSIDNSQIMLDEMPYGNFAEIESNDAAEIKSMADKLGLKWDERCVESYMALFEKLKAACSIEAYDLTFSALEGHRFTARDMGLSSAD